MKYLQVKNFDHYQHYQKGKNLGRNGCPTWIKLYARLIDGDDLVYDHLTDAAKITYVHMMLLASKHRNFITYDLKWIRKRLNLQGIPRIGELIEAGFLQVVECENPRNVLGTSYDFPSLEVEENRIEEKKKRVEKKSERVAPDKPDAPPAPSDLILTFPCSGDPKVWYLTKAMADEWQAAFPAVNVLDDLRLAHVKIVNGAVNKKTANGMRKFLINWIARTNNSIRPQKPNTTPAPPADRTELYREAARTGGPVFVES